MKRHAALVLVLAGLLAASLLTGTAHAQGAGGAIRIGLLYDLSGPWPTAARRPATWAAASPSRWPMSTAA